MLQPLALVLESSHSVQQQLRLGMGCIDQHSDLGPARALQRCQAQVMERQVSTMTACLADPPWLDPPGPQKHE